MVIGELLSGIIPVMGQIIKAPLTKPSLIWQLAPILCIWILVEFYFGTHKKERLGWNTALSNGISLFWIVISAMQHIFSEEELFTWTKFGLIAGIALYALFVIYISFKHSFKAKLTFMFASPTPLFYFSAMVLLFAHDLIALNATTFAAIAILFILIIIFVTILKKLLPEMKEDDEDFKQDNKLDMNFDNSLPTSSDLEPHMPDIPTDFNQEPVNNQTINTSIPPSSGLEQQLNTNYNQPKF